ncbi:uncharacterized protein LOC130966861 [Arachis stenosperma]|uniref:uncharacterized protein LOC130966861 n=1 Tax=Arachis stenosperma TaxID=217475 RepID=UPI0025AD7712|nr:uncharacterized protein LOC130966861 [Arachis stenosperma]
MGYEDRHIPQEQNARADALSKLASIKPGDNNRSLIQETLENLSTSEEEKGLNITDQDQGWITLIINYLKSKTLPVDKKEAKRLIREAQYYTLVHNVLYRRGFSMPLLKCVPTSSTKEVLEEVHSGMCGNHLGARALSKKWIEAEPLAVATAQRHRKFLYRNIVTRFGVPFSITTDNSTQFTDTGFRNLVADLKIKHQFISVEHPQANGQKEAANKVILAGLKRRL